MHRLRVSSLLHLVPHGRRAGPESSLRVLLHKESIVSRAITSWPYPHWTKHGSGEKAMDCMGGHGGLKETEGERNGERERDGERESSSDRSQVTSSSGPCKNEPGQ